MFGYHISKLKLRFGTKPISEFLYFCIMRGMPLRHNAFACEESESSIVLQILSYFSVCFVVNFLKNKNSKVHAEQQKPSAEPKPFCGCSFQILEYWLC